VRTKLEGLSQADLKTIWNQYDSTKSGILNEESGRSWFFKCGEMLMAKRQQLSALFTEIEWQAFLERFGSNGVLSWNHLFSPHGRKFAVFVDGSDRSIETVKMAVSWKNMEDALVIVHAAPRIAVVPTHLPAAGESTVGMAVEALETEQSMLEYSRAKSAKIVEEALAAAKKFRFPLTKVETAVLEPLSDHKTDALEYIEREKFDAVFVGSRGIGAIKRLFLGSFSNFLVNEAKCNVYVHRPRPEQQQYQPPNYRAEETVL